MRTIVLFALILTAAFGQQTVTPANVTFSADAVAVLQNYFVDPSNITSTPTTLAAPLSAGATTMTVASTDLLAINQEFLIDKEAVNPTAINTVTKVVTISRADIGTTAAAHLSGATVSLLKYKSLKNWCKQSLAESIAQIMSIVTFPTGATQDAIIATANAAKQAAKDAAIQ